MENIRRKYLRSALLFSGAIGVFKSVPVARACGGSYDGPEYRPIAHQLDISYSPITEYLVKFFNTKLQIQKNASLNISTKEYAEHPAVVPTQVEIPVGSFMKSFKNMECSQIDIFSQVMDGILEGPIYRIASYTFSNNVLPNIGLRYRRDFTYSRLIAVATLINKTTKRSKVHIYNHTNTVRSFSCNLIIPG